jgi:hypothetical protein
MKYSKWIGLGAVVVVFIVAFQPWIYISSKNILVTGMKAKGTNFGRPALMNLIVSFVAGILFIAPSIMAKRANLFLCAFNVAWCIRNYIILSICRAGECPEKLWGLYVVTGAAIVMMIAALFPDVDLEKESGV